MLRAFGQPVEHMSLHHATMLQDVALKCCERLAQFGKERHTLLSIKAFYKYCRLIDEFTPLSASWVIRARWREIQRFVRKFKTMKSIHDMQFWVFDFPKQKICAQR